MSNPQGRWFMEPKEKPVKFFLVEKRNPLAVHCVFESAERAAKFLADTVPDYCARGYYMDKSLTPQDFEVIKGAL